MPAATCNVFWRARAASMDGIEAALDDAAKQTAAIRPQLAVTTSNRSATSNLARGAGEPFQLGPQQAVVGDHAVLV
jgi:hypothetical protein